MEHSDLLSSTFACTICHQGDLLFVNSCPNHFMCVTCMDRHIMDSPLGKNVCCPHCRTSLGRHSIDVDRIIPPSYALHIAYGDRKVNCPGCTLVDLPADVIRHYYSRCESRYVICPLCDTTVKHKDLNNHDCRNTICDHENCTFRLYSPDDTREKAKKLSDLHRNAHLVVDRLYRSIHLIFRSLDSCSNLAWVDSKRSRRIFMNEMMKKQDCIESLSFEFENEVLLTTVDIPHAKSQYKMISREIEKLSTMIHMYITIATGPDPCISESESDSESVYESDSESESSDTEIYESNSN